MQESSSSHSIPHVALTADSKVPPIAYSASNNSEMSAHSSNTPQFKKKLIADKTGASAARESGGHIAKHQSFDYAKSKQKRTIQQIELKFSFVIDFFFCFL